MVGERRVQSNPLEKIRGVDPIPSLFTCDISTWKKQKKWIIPCKRGKWLRRWAWTAHHTFQQETAINSNKRCNERTQLCHSPQKCLYFHSHFIGFHITSTCSSTIQIYLSLQEACFVENNKWGGERRKWCIFQVLISLFSCQRKNKSCCLNISQTEKEIFYERGNQGLEESMWFFDLKRNGLY